MKASRIIGLTVVLLAWAGAAGQPAELVLSIELGGTGSVAVEGSHATTVAPGDTVSYEIWGLLSDTVNNEGLALFGYDLTCTGPQGSADICDLPPADQPVGDPGVNPMVNFVRPLGITNPDNDCDPADPTLPRKCGFRGTIINGDIVQGGGGQNNILNCDPDNTPVGEVCPVGAEFPTGEVIPGLGHSRIMLMSGSFNAPALGVYLVDIPVLSVFGNVIVAGEVNDGTFWVVESIGDAPVITSLTVTVEVAADPVNVTRWDSEVVHLSVGGAPDFLPLIVPLVIPARNAGTNTPSFSEPRLMARQHKSRFRVVLSGPVDPATAIAANVSIVGKDSTGADLTAILAGHVITVTTQDLGKTLIIEFTPQLPDFSIYTITLTGMTNTGGEALGGDTSRCLVNVLGDVNGDRAVLANDVGGTLPLVGTVPIDTGILVEIRADVNADGAILANDIGGMLGKINNIAAFLTCP